MNKIAIYDVKKRDFDSDEFKEVLRIQILLSGLNGKGAEIDFINKVREPALFDSIPVVKALFDSEGPKAFPCMTVNGEVVLKGRYPSDDKVREALGVTFDMYELNCSDSGCEACGKCGGHC